ncbi:hypothetical protein [Leptolyngbya sp. PCC 6406]|uniref:hypothetical protein n=1 Tax=Leptolyngbya sp. PCC 6406 TaxID=1173264 RepID=UPI00090727B7|nr:hypothetical protein [Leptolyngbya sp. PCC 6406]
MISEELQKGYPFEVLLPSTPQIQEVILADKIKCLNWDARGVQLIEAVPESVIGLAYFPCILD